MTRIGHLAKTSVGITVQGVIPRAGNIFSLTGATDATPTMYHRTMRWRRRSGPLPVRYTPTNLTLGSIQVDPFTASGRGTSSSTGPGGGGDYWGTMSFTFSYALPEVLATYLKSDGIYFELGIQVSFTGDPTFQTNKGLKFTMDWSAFLDNVVQLGIRKLYTDDRTEYWLLQFWGILKPSIPAYKTTVVTECNWISNNTTSNWSKLLCRITVDTTIIGDYDAVRPSLTELDFEIIDHESLITTAPET